MNTVPKTKAARLAILARCHKRYAERLFGLRFHIESLHEYLADFTRPAHFREEACRDLANCEAILGEIERKCGLRP